MALLERTAPAAVIEQIRRLAAQSYPLGEIAKRANLPLEEARAIADLAKIRYVRDNRTGGPRVVLATKTASHAYLSGLREGFVARMEHQRRLAKARPLSAAEEQDAIERFLREKGATKCPSAYLDTGAEPAGGLMTQEGSRVVGRRR